MNKVILDLVNKIKAFERDPKSLRSLPDNTYYLDNDYILCGKRKYGVSRYPYEQDGLTVWVSDNGHITANESELTIFRPSYTDETPCMGFFMGIRQQDGSYFPVCATRALAQSCEPYSVKRYTVFAPAAAYYIAYTDDWIFAVRVFVDLQKRPHFTLHAVNLSQKAMDIYFASCFEALLRYEESETRWNKKARTSHKLDNHNFVLSTEHLLTNYLCVNYAFDSDATQIYASASSFDFLGEHGRTFANALSLKRGQFENCDRVCSYASLPVAANLAHYTLAGGKSKTQDTAFTLCYDKETAMRIASEKAIATDLTETVAQKESLLIQKFKRLNMEYTDWTEGDLDPAVFNQFLKNVQRQVDVCAFGKSYAGPRLGIRDVFQQLEAAILWEPDAVRQRIVSFFSYLDPSGRAPRQITIPPTDAIMPNIDIRPFIDQGFWMIDTVYTYLCYTGDYSILREECGYCILPDDDSAILSRCEQVCHRRDSLLAHMLQIVAYLESKLDTQYGTDCLRVLFGDWNDVLDGMGRSKDPQKRYGSGVTVMGTLQFYRNLEQMKQILAHIGGFGETLVHYEDLQKKIQRGFFTHAVQTDAAGDKRIVHGWGDALSYYVGSFCDTDGENRISFAPNAFYALSGMMEADGSLQDTAIRALKALDSSYGLKTLTPAFSRNSTGVGRICATLPGTAENCCAYVHASLFSICALFAMGESEFAWEQITKSIVITHEKPSLTTFVMPNSYLENPDRGIDGESAGDWYTGAGTVLIKGLVKYGFGIMPDLDGLTVAMPRYMPCTSCKISVVIRGCSVTVKYCNTGCGHRSFTVNKKAVPSVQNRFTNSEAIYLGEDALQEELTIVVTD